MVEKELLLGGLHEVLDDAPGLVGCDLPFRLLAHLAHPRVKQAAGTKKEENLRTSKISGQRWLPTLSC